MGYRWTKQPNGLYTLHDYAIFAKCKRGKNSYDDEWLCSAVENAQQEERNGILPSVHVGHSRFGRHDREESIGRIANQRVRKITVGRKRELGIVADLIDLDKQTLDKITHGRLPHRSIEARKPMEEKQIHSLALLGSTHPYHRMRQGSEPVDVTNQPEEHFQAYDDGAEVIAFHDLETFMMDPTAVLQQIKALLDQALGGQAPGNPGQHPRPAAPSPMGGKPAMMEANEEPEADEPEAPTEAPAPTPEPQPEVLDQFAAVVGELEAAKAKIAQLEAGTSEQEQVGEVEKFLADLESEGAVFNRASAESLIETLGLERFQKDVAPNYLRAPVDQRTPAPTKNSVQVALEKFEDDDDLKTFSRLPEILKPAALEAAAEWDANEADPSAAPLTNATRREYIQTSVNLARQSLRG